MSVPYMIDYPAAYERVCQQLAEANASIKQFDELTDRQSIHISDLAHEVDKANAKIAELQAKLEVAEPLFNLHVITHPTDGILLNMTAVKNIDLPDGKYPLYLSPPQVEAKMEVSEPVAWMFQHEETGRTMCVDVVQVENGFEQNNPRLQKIAPLFTAPPQVEAAVEDFRRRAVEVCNKIVRVATIPESTTEAFSGYSRAMKHNEIKQEIESLPAFEEKGE